MTFTIGSNPVFCAASTVSVPADCHISRRMIVICIKCQPIIVHSYTVTIIFIRSVFPVTQEYCLMFMNLS